MRAGPVIFLLAGTLVGCEKAEGWDSDNPVQCMTIFGLASAGAATRGNATVANDLNARMLRIVEANGGVAWIEQITPETRRLAAEIEAAGDDAAVRKLFDECAAQRPPAY